MEVERATPPPYMARSPVDLGRPPAPPDELVALRRGQADITLPGLQTVLSHEFDEEAFPPVSNGTYGSPTASVRSLPRIEPRPMPYSGSTMLDSVIGSPSANAGFMEGEHRGRQSAEEIKMREAAEALAVLQNTCMCKHQHS
jgi:hypothetical protein